MAGLLGVELEVAKGTDREPELSMEYGRVQHDELLDEAGSVDAYRRVVALRPGDDARTRAIADHREQAGSLQGARIELPRRSRRTPPTTSTRAPC